MKRVFKKIVTQRSAAVSVPVAILMGGGAMSNQPVQAFPCSGVPSYQITAMQGVWVQPAGGSGTYYSHSAVAAGPNLLHHHYSNPRVQTVDVNDVSAQPVQSGFQMGQTLIDPPYDTHDFESYGEEVVQYERTNCGSPEFTALFQGWLTVNADLSARTVARFRGSIEGKVEIDGEEMPGILGEKPLFKHTIEDALESISQDFSGKQMGGPLYSEWESFAGGNIVKVRSIAKLKTIKFQDRNNGNAPDPELTMNSVFVTAAGITNMMQGQTYDPPRNHQLP